MCRTLENNNTICLAIKMSKLLFNAPPLVIDKDIAVILGLNAAIVLQQIHYWLESNKKMGKNFHKEKYWTFNSISKWQEQFPFWSQDTVKRAISKLRKSGILLTDNFNKVKIDRTIWYTIDYQKLAEKVASKRADTMHQCISADCTNALGQIAPTISADCTNALGQIAPTITKDYTENTTEKKDMCVSVDNSKTEQGKITVAAEKPEVGGAQRRNPAGRDSYSEEFKEFWSIYPRSVEKRKASSEWRSRLREGVLPKDLIKAARNYADFCHTSKTMEQFIKHPATFLGADRPFEDFVERRSANSKKPKGVECKRCQGSGFYQAGEDFVRECECKKQISAK